MNLILIDSWDERVELSWSDPRALHIREVLKMKVGDKLFVGMPNGPRGQASILAFTSAGLVLGIDWESWVERPLPIKLIVGMPRPQTARKILQEGTSLGVESFHFFLPEKGELSYKDSKLWQSNEWEKHLRLGAEQAFVTFIPEVFHYDSLELCIQRVQGEALKVALDNYEASCSLSQALKPSGQYLLALGAERGWSAAERLLLRERGFALAHLSERVLRVETACVAALSLIASLLGKF